MNYELSISSPGQVICIKIITICTHVYLLTIFWGAFLRYLDIFAHMCIYVDEKCHCVYVIMFVTFHNHYSSDKLLVIRVAYCI